MPTENRSSNTEKVSVPPYIGLEPLVGRYYPAQCRRCGWVGSSEELTEDDAQCTRHVGDRLCLGDCDELERHDLLNIIQAMTQRPHPEPLAWMVGTAIWWTKEEAERDAAATGLPIVGLGPMTGIAPAERHLSEPVCLDGATFMGEPNFQHSIEWYREGISKHWKKICDLRAEVARLRAALKFYADREHYHFESGNWDTVSGEPLNILWCGEEPDFIEDGTVARNALSAIAEPSAPTEIDRDALVAAVCVLRSQGLGNLSEAVETARAALERNPA
ncbi:MULTISPECIES: hypothetical protein [unclassified Pseudomonas]|uniref:hypothetical protein n=1 Tax=unclassified Pseudomonas TaxID=196821 RepID=UPI001AEA00BC|nr:MULTISPECIES: hypothetical protein [unclassified Pseudomonas]HDS1695787.1 hypothetical protein [Pseudomonas putida]MBP2270786.1 hypothetical protein [Pseudomonas sp. BP6]MBP2284931.1 hypothetical protein [Pseudomonas sp. BP7]MBP2290254.1 hypothetical protein [Pseudomonas sp. BP7]HDS1701009.1 hypothetical protein [Pseudomonas putida]